MAQRAKIALLLRGECGGVRIVSSGFGEKMVPGGWNKAATLSLLTTQAESAPLVLSPL